MYYSLTNGGNGGEHGNGGEGGMVLFGGEANGQSGTNTLSDLGHLLALSSWPQANQLRLLGHHLVLTPIPVMIASRIHLKLY
ncbi:MAG TPA: hypothetical protein VEL11_09475 [Candidatus Bathyarchaeia archaeon]|nr:hypothetical protein [Candidatus Bathyarchaeia archaeon]